MNEYCEIEFAIAWRSAGCYTLSVRYTDPDADSDIRIADPVEIRLDATALKPLEGQLVEYGCALTDAIFGDPRIREAFGKARVAAQAKSRSLRMRLFIGPDSADLQALRWEALVDPENRATPLATREDIVLSRYLSSLDWRPVPLRRKTDLRALIVVANPSDLARFKPDGRTLAPVDVKAEVDRAQKALYPIQCTVLAGEERPTVDRISEKLRDGQDILYLVCHGSFSDDGPRLWLEDREGKAARVPGGELLDRLRDTLERPRLIVLASCQSAGSGTGDAESSSSMDGGVTAALGPQLASAGIPAVIAMQGNVTMATVADFMPAFFGALAKDGQVDRAMAVARGAVRNRHDWWVPTLFMRLRSGRIWHDGGFAATNVPGSFSLWEGLASDIRDENCVPILGPGLVETLLGSLRDMARRWAERYDFPLAPHAREDLTQVAQFLAYRQTKSFPRAQLREYLKDYLVTHCRDDLPADLLHTPLDKVLLVDIIGALGRSLRQKNPHDVHTRLARLPFPIYVTANRDNLLYDALKEAGRDPQLELVRWKGGAWPKSIFDTEPGYEPTAERPLILHLFGNLGDPKTPLVLTEDDYFDFLIGVTRGRDVPYGNTESRPSIPECVSCKLAESGLMFLGFQIDDWEFRVLYRGILVQEGDRLSEEHARVAVQLQPSEGRILEPIGARNYLERYFSKTHTYGVFWGGVDDFMDQLMNHVSGRGVLYHDVERQALQPTV